MISIVFSIYVSQFYRANDIALKALNSDEVDVIKTSFGWIFDGPSEEKAFVFYPGAKVEETAYASILCNLAEEGIDVFLIKEPFHFAFFKPNAAAKVMQQYDYENWYVGGHSLGGAIAANFAAKHGDELKGLVLLAAYPTKLLDPDLKEIVLYGSEDEVLNIKRVEKGREYAPEDYLEVVIEGGNHAQFGNYGVQKGDGTAKISAEEQQEQTVRAIIEFLDIQENN